MRAHDVPLLWCVFQTAIIASLGLVAGWLMSRRSPAAAATATASAAATILVVTLLVPVQLPMPSLSWPGHSGDLLVSPSHTPFAAKTIADNKTGGLSVDVGNAVAQILKTVGAGALVDQRFAPLTEPWLVGISAIGATFGLVRLMKSLRYIARLRRGRGPIVCDNAGRLFAELKQTLRIRPAVELCESAELISPAVIGWRRPLILLPVDRTGWTQEELRAALAHELAHVVRGDFVWRMAAVFTQSIHFFHPLVYLLTRRLALVQELATDHMAAAAVGGKANYLRALSELAIRLDDQNGLRSDPIVLPAFSSNLLRRIAMLRSKEGTAGVGQRSAAGVATAAMIAIVGIGTMVMRGSAEPVEPTPINSPPTLFTRPAVDASIIGDSDKGIFIVRLGELSQRPVFIPVFKLANRILSEQWKEAFGVAAPQYSFESIDYIAGVPQLIVEPFKNEKDPNVSGRVMISCEDFVVRFQKKVSWQSWIKTYVPGAEEINENGFSYTKLPELAFIGPARLCVAARDGQTLVCTTDVGRLRKLGAAVTPKSDSGVSSQWNSLEGGLVTFLATDARIDTESTSPKDPGAVFATTIFKNATRFGVGFDLDTASNQSSFRVDLKCRDHESAERIRAIVATMLPLAKTQLRAMIDNQPELVLDGAEREKLNLTAGGPDTDRQVGEFWMNALNSCKAETVTRNDGTPHVRITTMTPFPTQILKAYEVADKSTAADSGKR